MSKVADFVGLPHKRLFLQPEGYNPSGSFKDNGMSAAVTHAKMLSVKKRIERKQSRLNRLVQYGQITQSEANEMLREFAKFVSRYFGSGAQLFHTITATNMLILVAAVLVALS